MAASYLTRQPNLPLGGRPTKSAPIQAIRKRGVQIFARTSGPGFNPSGGGKIRAPHVLRREFFGYLAWLSVGVGGGGPGALAGTSTPPAPLPLQQAATSAHRSHTHTHTQANVSERSRRESGVEKKSRELLEKNLSFLLQLSLPTHRQRRRATNATVATCHHV